jgi:hypothetical protein
LAAKTKNKKTAQLRFSAFPSAFAFNILKVKYSHLQKVFMFFPIDLGTKLLNNYCSFIKVHLSLQ